MCICCVYECIRVCVSMYGYFVQILIKFNCEFKHVPCVNGGINPF